MPKVEHLTLSRQEVEALAAHFRFSYIDPNRTIDLYRLVTKIDIWLKTYPREEVPA